MTDSTVLMPDAEKAKTDTSVDVHTAAASAPAEQQLEDAAGPSQQSQVQRMFGEQRCERRHCLKFDTPPTCCV